MHTCTRCDEPIERGEEVVQMLGGLQYSAITPAFVELVAEWHSPCFHDEFQLNRQTRPYQCQECGKEIGFGERISCLVRGKETGEYHTVAEGRGYDIYTVKHYSGCLPYLQGHAGCRVPRISRLRYGIEDSGSLAV